MPKPNDWIYFAKEDLNGAKTLLASNVALASVFYLCQQSAEKSLKGYLLFKCQEIRKTHDLELLCELCVVLDSDFTSILIDATDLSPFATKTRYPDDYYIIPSIDTALIYIQKAEKILEFVKYKIK